MSTARLPAIGAPRTGGAATGLRAVVTKLRTRKKLTIGLFVLLLVILTGAFNGNIVDWIGAGSNTLAYGPHWAPSSMAYPLGTDLFGRDILALTVVGLWTSLKVGFYAGILSTAIGVTIAFFAAYKGGVLDAVLRTTTDTFLVVPSLPLLIAYTGFAKNVTLFQISLILAVFSWPGAARAIRSQVLSLRTRGYVDLAKMTKLNTVEIIFEELVPNMLPYLALGLALSAIGAIFGLISLEVIGLGPTTTVDLGLLINEAITSGALTLGAWPLFIAPIFFVVLIFGSLNLINIGLDEVFNPRLRRVAGV
jgi:peptide/nickel transport system permease protein